MGEEVAAAVVLEPPRPKSPPRYPDLCGRRRLQLELQILNREIDFLKVRHHRRRQPPFVPFRLVLLRSVRWPVATLSLPFEFDLPQLKTSKKITTSTSAPLGSDSSRDLVF